MNLIANLITSSLGRKFLMAGSGAVLFLFLVGHLLGNLQIFFPPEAINRYARTLESQRELLWSARVFLLVMAAVHLWATASLTVENRAARPQPYGVGSAPFAASLASRTMLGTGLVIAAFVVYHLLHFTAVVEGINGASLSLRTLKERQDVYAMVIAGFSVWYVSLLYLLAVGLVCVHLSHGIRAMFQSLGLRNAAYSEAIDRASKVIALALFLGFASIPTSVMVFGHGKAYLQEVVKAPPARVAVAEAGKESVR